MREKSQESKSLEKRNGCSMILKSLVPHVHLDSRIRSAPSKVKTSSFSSTLLDLSLELSPLYIKESAPRPLGRLGYAMYAPQAAGSAQRQKKKDRTMAEFPFCLVAHVHGDSCSACHRLGQGHKRLIGGLTSEMW